MTKRFNKENLTLEKLQEVREKINTQAKQYKADEVFDYNLTLEEEDLLMLGEDGINTLDIPEIEENAPMEMPIDENVVDVHMNVLMNELAKVGILPKKTEKVDENGNTYIEEVLEFENFDKKTIEEAKQRTIERIEKNRYASGSTLLSGSHSYDGIACTLGQFCIAKRISGGNMTYGVFNSGGGVLSHRENFTVIGPVNSSQNIRIKFLGPTSYRTGDVANDKGKWDNFSPSYWIHNVWGSFKAANTKYQPLFRVYYSTNGGLPIYDGGKNQIGKRAADGKYITGRHGAKCGSTMHNWIQIEYYQDSAGNYKSAGSNHPYFVSAGTDTKSMSPFVRCNY